LRVGGRPFGKHLELSVAFGSVLTGSRRQGMRSSKVEHSAGRPNGGKHRGNLGSGKVFHACLAEGNA
jgi:hypothetical protein